MKERQMLFKGEMVCATLEGRKTQTRRAVKLPKKHVWGDFFDGQICPENDLSSLGYPVDELRCPYGQPGDRLWVKETWAEPTSLDPGPTFYRADYPACVPTHFSNVPAASAIKWRPSIHMRRDQSRITLEITDVRVERLQDISGADAKAEGADCLIWNGIHGTSADLIDWPLKEADNPYRNGFALLWEAINGDGSWNANPWVWVIEFKRMQP